MPKVGKARIEISAEDRTKLAFANVKRGLRGINEAGSKTRVSIAALATVFTATAVAATAAAVAYARFTMQAAKMANTLQDAANKLKVSTDFMQGFQFAALKTGIAAKQAETGLQRLFRRFGEAQDGRGVLLPILKKYNIAFKNMDGTARDSIDIFKDFADAVKAAKSPTEQLAMTVSAFDTEGAGLVTMLRGGSAAIDDFVGAAKRAGVVTSKLAVQQLSKLQVQLETLRLQGIAAFSNSLTDSDGLIEAVKGLGDVIKSDEFASALKSFAELMESVAVTSAKAADKILEAWTKYQLFQQALAAGKNFDFSDVESEVLRTGIEPHEVIFKRIKSWVTGITGEYDKISAKQKELKPPEEKEEDMGSFDPFEIKAKGPHVFLKDLTEFQDKMIEVSNDIPKLIAAPFQGAFEGISESIQGVIKGTMTWQEALMNVASTIANALVKALADWVAAWITNQLIMKAFNIGQQATAAAAATATAGTVLAAATPAAVAMAIATNGAALVAGYAAQAQIAASGVGSAIFGAIAGKADGGPVSGGTPYVVGERGPELFIPKANGAIVPNHKMGNQGATVIQNINISPGIEGTVRAEIVKLMPAIQESAKQGVLDSAQRGGAYAKRLRG